MFEGTKLPWWKIKRVVHALWQRVAYLKAPTGTRMVYLGEKQDFFRDENLPPWSVDWVEPIHLPGIEERERLIAEAGYNTFALRSNSVSLDSLTDSGASAGSRYQWEGLEIGDEAYAGSENVERFRAAVKEILGYPYMQITHQGRAAEHLVSRRIILPGQFVPNNMYFTTRRAHQEGAGGIWLDFAIPEAYDSESTHPFKGNWDLQKLEDFLRRTPREKVACLSCEASVNMAGGQPFSLENLRGLYSLAQEYGIPIWLDATRIFCNAFQIKEREVGHADRSVREITREICLLTDICTFSGKKDCLANNGGFLAGFNQNLIEKISEDAVIFQGLDYGGMSGRDIEFQARGMEEFSRDEEVGFYIRQVRCFGERLIEKGIPLVLPIGAHGVFLDAKRFAPHLSQDEFPAQSVAAAIYVASGIRTMERGVLSGKHGDDPYNGLELVRITIPRRVYTDRHFDYAVDAIDELHQNHSSIKGLTLKYAPEHLRFFKARFERN